MNNVSERTKDVDKIYEIEREETKKLKNGSEGQRKLTWDNVRSRKFDRRGILEKE
jgi:hypothetical protein